MGVSGSPANRRSRDRCCFPSSAQLRLATLQARGANCRSVRNSNRVLRRHVCRAQTIQAYKRPENCCFCHRSVRTVYRVGGDVLRWSTRHGECKNVRGQLRPVLSVYECRDLYRGSHLLFRKAQAKLVVNDYRFAVTQMANGNRLTFAIVGGVFCAIVGSLLGALILLLFALRGVGIDAVAFYPIAFLYVAFLAVPFGFVAGSVGSCLLAVREAHGVSGRRLYFESAGIGGILGGTYPLIFWAFGWGPFSNLVSTLPISTTIGIACGILIIPLTRKYRPSPSSNF